MFIVKFANVTIAINLVDLVNMAAQCGKAQANNSSQRISLRNSPGLKQTINLFISTSQNYMRLIEKSFH